MGSGHGSPIAQDRQSEIESLGGGRGGSGSRGGGCAGAAVVVMPAAVVVVAPAAAVVVAPAAAVVGPPAEVVVAASSPPQPAVSSSDSRQTGAARVDQRLMPSPWWPMRRGYSGHRRVGGFPGGISAGTGAQTPIFVAMP